MERNEFYQAAEAILLIIQYEGEIEDVIEYPSEFEEVYKELLQHNVILKGDGKFLPAKNFRKARKLGYRKFLESLEKPSLYKKYFANKPILGFVAGAVIITAGYLINSGRETNTYPGAKRNEI